MQYGHSVLDELGTADQQRYTDNDIYKSWVVFGQPELVMIENMG